MTTKKKQRLICINFCCYALFILNDNGFAGVFVVVLTAEKKWNFS